MPLPRTTHQQFAVLNTLKDGEQWGRDIRAALKSQGYASTNASFYEMMDRLETGGLTEGWYEEREVLGQSFRERRYKITAAGIAAWEEVAAFYTARLGLGFQGGT